MNPKSVKFLAMKMFWQSLVTYQEYFYSTKDVHWGSKSGSQIKQKPNSSTKFRTKSTWNHKISSPSWKIMKLIKTFTSYFFQLILWHVHKFHIWLLGSLNTGFPQAICSIISGQIWNRLGNILPGTTPFVAMALIEMAVNIVYKAKVLYLIY